MIRVVSDSTTDPPIVMTMVTDPEEIARMNAQWEQADKNAAWLEQHVEEIYAQNRGKYLCVSGQEAFIADTPQEAVGAARAKHPDDRGYLLRFIPLEKRVRI